MDYVRSQYGRLTRQLIIHFKKEQIELATVAHANPSYSQCSHSSNRLAICDFRNDPTINWNLSPFWDRTFNKENVDRRDTNR